MRALGASSSWLRELFIAVVVAGCAVAAPPDVVLPGNLATLGCAAPDTKFVFVRSSQPGNVFYPGDEVDVTLKLTRGAEPLTQVTVEVTEIATRQNLYLEGQSVMTPPPAIENRGIKGRLDVPVALAELAEAGAGKEGATAEIEAKNIPVPGRYGTYVLTVAPNGRDPQFLCTLVRTMKPPAGFNPDFPVFGEGQFLTHDNQSPELIRQRALTLGRLGIRGIRIELGPPMQAADGSRPFDWSRYDALMNACAEAKIKCLVTMGGHATWSLPFGTPTPAASPWKADHSCMPKYYERFGQAIHDFCARYWHDGQGAVWAIEHWNEPWEGISISGWESCMPHYRELMKRIADNARKVSPEIKTAAACSIMNTEDKFFAGDDREEMAKLIDLFTDHYVPPRTSYGPMVAKFWGKESTDTESWIAATEVVLPQVMCQFLASGQDRVTPWHPQMTYFSVPGAPMKHQMPNPVALASSIFNNMIGDRPFERVLFLTHLPWGFQFGDGDDAVVVYFGRLMPVWGENLEAYRDTLWWQMHLQKGGTVTINNADGALEFYDIAGNPEFDRQKQVTLSADYLAHYIKCPEGGAKVIAERLRAARLDGFRPVEIIARDFTAPVQGPGRVTVTLHNLLNRPLKGRLTLTPPPNIKLHPPVENVALAAGETRDVTVRVADATPDPANAYLFGYRFESDAGDCEWREILRAAVVARGTRRIDGDLTDWEGVPGITVDAELEKVDPTQQAWLPFVAARDKQPDGSFGEVKLAWDEAFLYLSASVNDRTDSPGHERLETGKWDEEQYFRSAADDEICESLRPFEKFVRAYPMPWSKPDQKQAYEELKKDPGFAKFAAFLEPRPEAKAAIETNAPQVYFDAKKRNPAATFGDATHVYKRAPWDAQPFSGDMLQFGLDLLPGYYFRMKPDVDRVPYGFHAMPDTDYEYSAYACKDGGTELWRLLAPGVPRGHRYPRQPRAAFDQAPVPDGQCVVRREGAVTTYELAIPWKELTTVVGKPTREPFRPTAGQTFGFTFVIRNNDGPALFYGKDKSATKTNGLSLHPYWTAKPSCTVRWALGE